MRVETLRSLLEQGHPITILDVRPEPERQDWAIPNSLFFPGLYEAVNQGNEQALDAVALPTDQLIVVVCGAGKTSQRVAALLRARGYQAESLEGGMRAWSFAWSVARTVLAGGAQRRSAPPCTGAGALAPAVAGAPSGNSRLSW
ncbi:MAG: hypothetical protein IRY86_05710, partial [Thermorudis peleae]|nr:hypothetical protein [Thermorudis peleae]